MIDELKKYPAHYVALGLILSFGISAILAFRFDETLKQISTYALAGMYILWGVFHHRTADHLRLKVVLEYVLVAALAVVIIDTLI